MLIKLFAILGGVFCMTSVMLGAFAAHGLKKYLNEYALSIFKTASTYQMTHGLALIAIAILIHFGVKVTMSGWFFIIGVLLFSGSLYFLALTQASWLGPMTPIGGVFLILGWAMFIYGIAIHSFK